MSINTLHKGDDDDDDDDDDNNGLYLAPNCPDQLKENPVLNTVSLILLISNPRS